MAKTKGPGEAAEAPVAAVEAPRLRRLLGQGQRGREEPPAIAVPYIRLTLGGEN